MGKRRTDTSGPGRAPARRGPPPCRAVHRTYGRRPIRVRPPHRSLDSSSIVILSIGPSMEREGLFGRIIGYAPIPVTLPRAEPCARPAATPRLGLPSSIPVDSLWTCPGQPARPRAFRLHLRRPRGKSRLSEDSPDNTSPTEPVVGWAGLGAGGPAAAPPGRGDLSGRAVPLVQHRLRG